VDWACSSARLNSEIVQRIDLSWHWKPELKFLGRSQSCPVHFQINSRKHSSEQHYMKKYSSYFPLNCPSVWGSHGGEDVDVGLLGFNAASTCRQISPTFRRNTLSSSPELKCLEIETVLRNVGIYRSTRHYNPEDQYWCRFCLLAEMWYKFSVAFSELEFTVKGFHFRHGLLIWLVLIWCVPWWNTHSLSGTCSVRYPRSADWGVMTSRGGWNPVPIHDLGF
jgi:hypothetical protein